MSKILSLTGALALSVSGAALFAQEGKDESEALAPPTCEYGEMHPDAPEELRQFDFLIGDYSVSGHRWMGEDWSPARPGAPARWNGRWIMGGTMIEDEWYGRDPGPVPDSPRGVNVRMWDAEDGEWDMMWVHSTGRQVQDLRAKVIDGKLTMWQVYPDRPNFRAYFERTGRDSWHRISLVPDENGEWVPQFKLAATRIPCPED